MLFQNCMCLNHLIYWNQMIFGKPLLSPPPPPPPITPAYRAAQDIDWDILILDP